MKIGIIGLGNMGSAILKGIVNSSFANEDIYVFTRSASKYEGFFDCGINIAGDSASVISNCDVIILAIKPNEYPKWLERNPLGEKILVSIAAGIDSEFLRKYTNRFILAMPNTPAVYGQGLTLIAKTTLLSSDIAEIFLCIGEVKIIEEEQMADYTLITGCSPAYFFNFVDNIIQATIRQTGITNEEEIKRLVLQVMAGSLTMMYSDKPSELCENVCSPGGITNEVITELNRALKQGLNEGFKRGLTRGKHLKEINEHISSN